MTFGWINGINAAAVACLVGINIVAARKGIAGSMESRHMLINVLEQAGRYGCMALMIFPVAAEGWKFGFGSAAGMVLWLLGTIVLLIAYGCLWMWKRKGGRAVLYGLALLPVCLFLLNGILLGHGLLTLSALLFGVCHVWILRENA